MLQELLLDVMPDDEARKIDLSTKDILRVLKLKLGLSEDDDLDVDELEELLLRRQQSFNPTGGFQGGPPPDPGGPGADPTFGRTPLPGGTLTAPPQGGAPLPFGPQGGVPSFLPPEILFDLANRMRRRRSRSFAPSRKFKISQAPPGGPPGFP